jgi:hypothetical protein
MLNATIPVTTTATTPSAYPSEFERSLAMLDKAAGISVGARPHADTAQADPHGPYTRGEPSYDFESLSTMPTMPSGATDATAAPTGPTKPAAHVWPELQPLLKLYDP